MTRSQWLGLVSLVLSLGACGGGDDDSAMNSGRDGSTRGDGGGTGVHTLIDGGMAGRGSAGKGGELRDGGEPNDASEPFDAGPNISDPDCTAGESRDCPDGCAGGRQSCDDGEWGDCVYPAERCNERDDDCDEEIDEDFAGLGDDCSAGAGECAATGVKVCNPKGTAVICGADPGEPANETCDGEDDDCDGTVDEQAQGAGDACAVGVGACRVEGAMICNQDALLVCDASALAPSTEVCDEVDNDCNEVTDDVAGVGSACSAGTGSCERSGHRVCDGANGVVCDAVAGEPASEVCDGEDNDCDGTPDDGPAGVGDACVVGVGACERSGNLVCDGENGLVCNVAEGEPSPEVCDGEDNDCDGVDDNDPSDANQPCNVGVGECNRSGTTVCGGGDLSCTAVAGTPASQDLCNGLDDDCDGSADENRDCNIYRSCAHAFERGATQSGIYYISATGAAGAARNVYCDQTTNGGGWTLVGSTAGQTLNDEASAWYDDLTTLAPAAAHAGIWNGLRALGSRFDVRFACRPTPGAAADAMAVDLSFYDVSWYTEFTTGTDAQSCFNENNGLGTDSRMAARRNNLNGAFRRSGDAYAPYLEGEDACDEPTDFTIDFDDRGMDGNENDGTDWGEDDSSRKCGVGNVVNGQWFVFARERPRVATIGLSGSVLTVLRNAGILTTNLAYDANLPSALTTENFDTVVIGRYATSWPLVTQNLKEALETFGRNGGNVVTEWEGASIFMAARDASYRYSAGAPSFLGWFPGRIGGGSQRGGNTAISLLTPSDPIFAGVSNPMSAGSGTEFFFWLTDTNGSYADGNLMGLKTLATFPGGHASFPAANYGAIYRGRYCDGNALYTTFDWSDDPTNAGFGPLLPQLVREASAPPPPDLIDQCQEERRPQIMRCGASTRDIATFGLGLPVVAGCTPDSNTQALFVTRYGLGMLPAAPALQNYVNGGGIIITEYSLSDEVYNNVFGTAVMQPAARLGGCADNLAPSVQFSADDAFWQDNRFAAAPDGESGCGYDVASYPGLVPLGGWTGGGVQIGYRDSGRGRVWVVEADWQDNQGLSPASLGFMRYMATHAAGSARPRGLLFSGVRTNEPISPLLKKGFQVCHRSGYGSTTPLSSVRDACVGDVLVMGCRQVGTDVLTVAAMGTRTQVFTDVGNGQAAAHAHNGVNWYYSPGWSWGFAPASEGVTRNSCDVASTTPGSRMCWHTSNDNLNSGYRCGSNFSFADDWERVVLHRNGEQPN